jgi:toxin YoeB
LDGYRAAIPLPYETRPWAGGLHSRTSRVHDSAESRQHPSESSLDMVVRYRIERGRTDSPRLRNPMSGGKGPGESRPDRRLTIIQAECTEDSGYWVRTDRKVALKVLRLVKAVREEPFTGIGKPEPLKHLGPDVWSRRITARDRLVYRVLEHAVDFIQARYHY